MEKKGEKNSRRRGREIDGGGRRKERDKRDRKRVKVDGLPKRGEEREVEGGGTRKKRGEGKEENESKTEKRDGIEGEGEENEEKGRRRRRGRKLRREETEEEDRRAGIIKFNYIHFYSYTAHAYK